MGLLKKLNGIFNDSEKKKMFLIFLLMLLGASIETLGVGLMVPYIVLMMNPDMIFQQPIIHFIYDTLRFTSTKGFLIFTTFVLMGVFIFKNAYLLALNIIKFRFVSNQQVRLSQRLFKAYLTKPYIFHVQRNSALLLRNTIGETGSVFNGIVMPGLSLLSEILVFACIVSLLLVVDPYVTVFSIAIISTSIGIFFKVFNSRMSKISILRQHSQGQMIKWVNQGLHASKEVKVTGKEFFFISSFAKESTKVANAERFYRVIIDAPRFFVEITVVATILATVTLVTLQDQAVTVIMSKLVLLAMAAVRLMPSINRIVGALTMIRSNLPSVDVLYEDLVVNEIERQEPEEHPVLKIVRNQEKTYKHQIQLKDVYYKYPTAQEYVLTNIYLTIPIGKSVAFIGASGAGKTTLIDIILGLLEPTKGEILVDGISLNKQLPLWRQKIGYIPQAIYLSDDSVRRNVAFGLEDDQIDDKAVWNALEAAQLKEFIEKCPEKINTFIGERGVRLSGGERQRIGIARALYHNPEILFLDEATSSLDNQTEKGIMQAIDRLKGEKTLIIIAHRLTTIENCDIIYEVRDGKLISKNIQLL